ncbi:chemotaxis protein CheW [Candidatus Methylospira mobilis]|uniref:Chemotaxis protein CheW n=1 Tax=Candidatus Methylospira mobilis TaxID=1808979 RepID=A0A5Q0BHD9_9GAMM|nr:chemotaxis protein CheW [Candidatus Methylospira mobilis]QFY42542.1 chemotaxis protein CheW [Candidatus Methylospira mobilis]WNV04347.1 chemotaxis protein CheW [Candidatus Methylospira mobilis]
MNTIVKTSADSTQGRHQYLTFTLKGEVFAIGILNIEEIIEYGQLTLTELPRMPLFIRGVIDLRGAAVPVVDLNACFGKEKSTITRRSCIVIVEVAHADESGSWQAISAATSSISWFNFTAGPPLCPPRIPAMPFSRQPLAQLYIG